MSNLACKLSVSAHPHGKLSWNLKSKYMRDTKNLSTSTASPFLFMKDLIKIYIGFEMRRTYWLDPSKKYRNIFINRRKLLIRRLITNSLHAWMLLKYLRQESCTWDLFYRFCCYESLVHWVRNRHVYVCARKPTL